MYVGIFLIFLMYLYEGQCWEIEGKTVVEWTPVNNTSILKKERRKCEYEATIDKDSYAVVYNLGYPKPYKKNINCFYKVYSKSIYRTLNMQCDLNTLIIRDNKKCRKHYMRVFYSGSKRGPNDRFCSGKNLNDLTYLESNEERLMVQVKGRKLRYYCTIETVDLMTTLFPTEIPTESPSPSPTPTPTTTTTTTSPPSGTCKCGDTFNRNSHHKIVGGQDVPRPTDYPWMAALGYTWGTSGFCGGALIHENWVLTAAHCVDGDSASWLRVSLGDYDRTKADGEIWVLVSKIIMHEGYVHAQTTGNDIALLKLATPAPYNDRVRPVCLPFGFENQDFNNENIIFTGWGHSQEGVSSSSPAILQEVEVPVVTNAECKTDYGSWGSYIYDTIICAGLPEGGKDTCQGDSGGPGIWIDSSTNKAFTIGAVSWAFGCAREGYPGANTRITSFLDWIEENTDGDTFCKPALGT